MRLGNERETWRTCVQGLVVNLKGLGIRSALHYPFPFHETTLGTKSERAIIP